MEYLTRSLLPADVSVDWQSRLCASDLSWLDGRRTAGEQAALVKHNRQLDPADCLTVQITNAVSEALLSDPLVKSFCFIRKIHSLLFSRLMWVMSMDGMWIIPSPHQVDETFPSQSS